MSYLFISILFCQISDKCFSFCFGIIVSLLNIILYYGVYGWHKHRISAYPAQALVAVVFSTAMRFMLVGTLLIWAFKLSSLSVEPVILGFVISQLIFLFNHLTLVKTNNVK
ncbi:MAG: hypothetical protein CSA44_03065 [Gammaproteobacteria bacterium]|nr:MAG: hypothetical protein CSA44_03065 [Gammaproteobacteria bacterium]